MLCYVCYASFVSQDIPDQEIAEHLKTEDKEPPHLIVFKRNGEVTASFVVGDGVSIMTEKSVSAATLGADCHLLFIRYGVPEDILTTTRNPSNTSRQICSL